ncbi:MAG: YceI family protein [Balneolaceae bacterium]
MNPVPESMARLLFFLLPLLMFLVFPAASANEVEARQLTILEDRSELAIEGTSNVNQFRCIAGQYAVDATAPNGSLSSASEENPLHIDVSILVKGFECGRSRMNRDLQDALLADEHPDIHFRYLSTVDAIYHSQRDLYQLLISGELTVAGTTRIIMFSAFGRLHDNQLVQLEGQTDILMTDYGIDPPSAMLGLVQVRDELTVHFNLFAELADTLIIE